MKTIITTWLMLATGAASIGAEHPGTAVREPTPASNATPPSGTTVSAPDHRPRGWSFSFLPKSLQRNPVLDMTVFTEMTDAGRAVEPPTPEKPVYYEEFSAGYRHVGDGPEQRKPPEMEDLEQALRKSLAAAGYRPAESPDHPATLLILMHWGAHTGIDPMSAEIDPNLALRNLAARAALVGGEAFAARLMRAYQDRIDGAMAMSIMPEGASDFFDPVNRFREQSNEMRHLVEQATDDVYFVVASAYDHTSVARGERVLLWRTRMTANTLGVSMRQTLPPLIATASPYFGRETAVAVPISKRGLPEGKVELGEPRVIGVVEDDAMPGAAAQAGDGEAQSERTKPPTPKTGQR